MNRQRDCKKIAACFILTLFFILSGCKGRAGPVNPKERVTQESVVQSGTSRDGNPDGNPASIEMEEGASFPENGQKDKADIKSGTSGASEEGSASGSDALDLDKDVYLRAMEKWETLGGNYDFKNVEGLNTATLARVYSSYLMNKGINPTGDSEYWMNLDGFDAFVEDYFGVSPEPFHNNYQGAYPDNYDAEKGLRFYPRTSILPDNATYQLLDYGINEVNTPYFEAEIAFELPAELFAEGEASVVRKINVTFDYVDQTVHFLSASYVQDGEPL